MSEQIRNQSIVANPIVRKALDALIDNFVECCIKCDVEPDDKMKAVYVQVAFVSAQHQLKVLRTGVIEAFVDLKLKSQAESNLEQSVEHPHKRRGRPPKFV